MWYLYSEWSIFSVLLLEQRIWTLSLSLTPAENFKKQRTHIAWMLTIPHKSATRTYFIYKYMLCLQDMNQAPTLALKSSLARQIGVKRCHVTDSWPNAEEGISAATTQHRRRNADLIRFNLPFISLSLLPSAQQWTDLSEQLQTPQSGRRLITEGKT